MSEHNESIESLLEEVKSKASKIAELIECAIKIRCGQVLEPQKDIDHEKRSRE